MKINNLTSFAAGLFLATSIFGLVYLSSDEKTAAQEEEQPEQAESLSEDEMKAILESKGYVVQVPTEESEENTADEELAESAEGEEQQAGDEQADESGDGQAKEENEQAEDARKEESNQLTELVITVEPGMTSIDVGKRLREANFIDKDPFSFSKDIEARNLQNKLYPGTYKVNSSMSYDELINAIFNQR